MLSLAHAKNVLRTDTADNDALIQSLLEAIPDYIEVTTGMSQEDQAAEPLVDTVSGFIVTLWYYSDHADDVKLQRTIDSLLKCITLRARTNLVGTGSFTFDSNTKTISNNEYSAYKVSYEELNKMIADSDEAGTTVFNYQVKGEE